MSYQEKYQKAREAGYSDEEIMEYLSKKDPSFEQKMEKAQEIGYTPQEVLSYFNTPKQEEKPEETGFKDYVSDFGKQAVQGLGVGAIGTYGDILDLLGVQAKEILPGEKAKYSREFDILEKMEQGNKPSFGELMELSGDDDIVPRYSRLPSSQEAEQLGSDLGLISEPKTAAGRYGRRIGKLGGAGAALGGGGIVAPIVAGIAGQTLEELGAPPWAQAAAEIIATLKYAPKSNVPVTSKSKEVEKVVQDLRKAGFSEQDITLAKNSLEQRNILKKISKPTDKSKRAFQHAEENTAKNFDKILESSFEGLTTEGPDVFKNISADIFHNLDEIAQKVPVSQTSEFAQDLSEIVKSLEKTLAGTPQENQIIEFLNKAIESSRPKFKGGKAAVLEQPSSLLDQFGNRIMAPGKPAIPAQRAPDLTADYYLRFYKGLNAIGQWDNPKQREFVFSKVKDAVKKVLVKQGKEGIEVANELERANKSWMKYLKAENISDLLRKYSTEDGINFTRLSKSLENHKNYDVLVDGLGAEKAKNLKLIADTGKSIKNLDKQITGDQAKQIFGSLKLWEFAKSVATLNLKSLGLIIGNELAGKFATKLLTDEKYQNIARRMMQAASDQKWMQMSILSRNLQSMLTKEGNQTSQEE